MEHLYSYSKFEVLIIFRFNDTCDLIDFDRHSITQHILEAQNKYKSLPKTEILTRVP